MKYFFIGNVSPQIFYLNSRPPGSSFFGLKVTISGMNSQNILHSEIFQFLLWNLSQVWELRDYYELTEDYDDFF
ncbi:hypothetical protein KHM19_04290 [Leptospira borgpetersenii]|uniref:Uncharacterized protein n=1 Tax=Leptospira borgpetersenii serovar Javanica str. UI 09931 TaxID=1049767 RepID=A0AAV3JBW5_LEPBO|nr:hypothetical protein C4Q31_02285 [Leptospira borgpetersenii serovar Ceylonica]EMN56910.1 hypothetical protein LEP1GSC090_1267 [Leptospira borgpetersenii serovar Javanica str. MK146]EPG58236.1 hypothetical protein LEP1GSC103_2985 [Leptospira borgpetersenii serovar Javanica str. UI 09931]GIM18089.1 hypothetical protein KHM09_05400 [Leptospira borgpetersenii]GIM21246.1 hypothetical protein KHM19_04290 [Leptospira borgpetersenii]